MDTNQVSIVLVLVGSWLLATDLLGQKRASALDGKLKDWTIRFGKPNSTLRRTRHKGDETRTRSISTRNSVFFTAFMGSTATAIQLWESESWLYAWPLKIPNLFYGWAPDKWLSGSVWIYVILGGLIIVTGRLLSMLHQVMSATPPDNVTERGYRSMGCLLRSVFFPAFLLLLPFIPAAFVGAAMVYTVAFLLWFSIWILFTPLRLSFSISERLSIEHPLRFLGLILVSAASINALASSIIN